MGISCVGDRFCSTTLEGNGSDDPLYFPTWQKIAQVIGHKKCVFIADCKAGSIATRAQIAASKGIYCVPVAMSGQHPQYLQQWVLNPPAEIVPIRLPRQDELEPEVGKGFEVELGKFWFNKQTNKWVRWLEQRTYSNLREHFFFVQSPKVIHGLGFSSSTICVETLPSQALIPLSLSN